jgi:UDP-galactopyranose mutase
LQFKHETHDKEWFQSNSVVNYPNEHLYTRITEFKYLTGQVDAKTSIVYEFPRAEGDPYYPVPKPENQELYKQYKALADETVGVHFIGRLATYKYYNMDQVTGQALALFKQLLPSLRSGMPTKRKDVVYPTSLTKRTPANRISDVAVTQVQSPESEKVA